MYTYTTANWTMSGQTLLIAANPNQLNATLVLQGIANGTAREVLNGGAERVEQNGAVILTLEPTGTSAWVFLQVSSIKATVALGGGGNPGSS